MIPLIYFLQLRLLDLPSQLGLLITIIIILLNFLLQHILSSYNGSTGQCDTRHLPPSPNPSKIACSLCYNKHVNPWHVTADCPYKHPSFILDKETCEWFIQHNAIFGSGKKSFHKNQDIPHKGIQPPSSSCYQSWCWWYNTFFYWSTCSTFFLSFSSCPQWCSRLFRSQYNTKPFDTIIVGV